MPERKFHLFDTFEGVYGSSFFEENDQTKFSTSTRRFTDTSLINEDGTERKLEIPKRIRRWWIEDTTSVPVIMRILGLITARGGSKRIPGKNIRPLGGKPLIVWSTNVAKDIVEIVDILVSTDSFFRNNYSQGDCSG